MIHDTICIDYHCYIFFVSFLSVVITVEFVELPEESDQFRFLKAVCFANLKGTVGLIMTKASDMRILIPLDLSSRSFIPLSRFIRSSRPTPILTPSLVLFPPRSASAAHGECSF